jgi:hypothetical protein
LFILLDEILATDGELWLAESVRAEEQRIPELARRNFRSVTEERMAEMEDGHRVWVRILRARGRR